MAETDPKERSGLFLRLDILADVIHRLGTYARITWAIAEKETIKICVHVCVYKCMCYCSLI